MRRFNGAGLMLHTATDQEAVARAHVEGLAGAGNFQSTGDDVDDLLVRMAVCCADPALLHVVFSQKEFLVVSADQPGQARLRDASNEKLFLAEHHMEKGWVGAAHSHPHEQIVYDI